MLAELVEHVVGVDPDRDRITVAVVVASSQAELGRAEFPATRRGYTECVEWVDEFSSADARVWSVEGTASYGAGLSATLHAGGEWVVEFDRPSTRPTRDGAKSDGLDAVRAARELLGRTQWAEPRARGPREGLRALLVARQGAQVARTAAINRLKALVVTCPVELREQLRGSSTIMLVKRASRFRIAGDDLELVGTKTAMRAIARRIASLEDEVRDLDSQLGPMVAVTAPQLLEELGVGPVCAAQAVVSWSHPGRCRNDGAFARLAGAAPIEATSGQHQDRHRLNRGGDRQLNRALHTIAINRIRLDPETQAYVARRLREGKTRREARRCLKRYIARRLWRLLEHPPTALDNT